jgi:uncharacterized protein (DUF362 family)
MKTTIVECKTYEVVEVEKSFLLLCQNLGYDLNNPLGSIVKPGNTVFIKPNWVAHEYRKSVKIQDDIFSTITHPAVIRVVAKYVDIALQGEGKILIGDNPSIDCNFNKLLEVQDLYDLKEQLKVEVVFLDLRPEWCDDLKNYGLKDKMVKQQGDPLGSVKVNLGHNSQLSRVNSSLFRGVYTDRSESIARHTNDVQEYEFSKSLAMADVYISIPKMKTHHKVGTTLNLKGMVGTQANKNLLVHWRVGFPMIGGDEYPSFFAWFRSKFEKVTNRGAWMGNDTIWRMVVDLYNGFNSIRERKTFSIVDGIIGGEQNGPFKPRSKHAGVLIGGENLLEVDMFTSRLMGLNIKKIKYLSYFIENRLVDTKKCKLNGIFSGTLDELMNSDSLFLDFVTPDAWAELKKF